MSRIRQFSKNDTTVQKTSFLGPRHRQKYLLSYMIYWGYTLNNDSILKLFIGYTKKKASMLHPVYDIGFNYVKCRRIAHVK